MVWFIQRYQVWQRGAVAVQPPSLPCLQAQLYQRFDYFYRFLRIFCSFLPSWRLNRAKLQMFPFHLVQDSEPSYTINSLFHFWLRSNTGFNPLLSIPVSFSALQYFDCHEEFLWASVRKSVSVLSFKGLVFCSPFMITFHFTVTI